MKKTDLPAYFCQDAYGPIRLFEAEVKASPLGTITFASFEVHDDAHTRRTCIFKALLDGLTGMDSIGVYLGDILVGTVLIIDSSGEDAISGYTASLAGRLQIPSFTDFADTL